MLAITKIEVIDEGVVVPKGTVGTIKGVTWGNKDGYVMKFPNANNIFVDKENMSITNVVVKPKEEKEDNNPKFNKKKKLTKVEKEEFFT